MDKNVQLKEEEIVGQESVLSDIYPRSDTSSIEDNRTGENLDITLANIYEMINNKLTRVVNSVNGRSGSIVLSQEDVGLSNVDNISFDDIKSWTNETILNAFDNKNLVLSSTSETLARLLTYGDPAYNRASFFVTNWSTTDLRPALGKIRIPDPDDSSNPYKVYSRMLNTIEETDKAFTYENGKLNLNLAPDQHGLTIGSDGLRLDADVLKRGIRVFENFYYFENSEETSKSADSSIIVRDTGFLLDYLTGQDPTLDAPKATIRIGARKILSENGSDPIHYIDPFIANSLTEDVLIIITGTIHDRNLVGDNIYYNQSLVSTGPVIGYLKIDEEGIYNFYFVPFTISPGFGLINTVGNPWHEQQSPNGYYHNALSVNTIIDERNISSEYKNESRISYSGLQAIASASAPFNSMDDVKPDQVTPSSDQTDTLLTSMNFIMTPEGRTNLFDEYYSSPDYLFKGGLFVPTDASLCAMPYERYGYRTADESGERSNAFINWFAPTPYYANPATIANHKGFMNSPTFIGINLLKGYTEDENVDGSKTAYSLSGLRVIDPGQLTISKHNSRTLNWEMFGMNEEVDANRFITARYSHVDERLVNEGALDSPLTPADLLHTGGLMVNVGKGLEIMPFGVADNGVTFDRMGKVNVRLGAGLEFDKYNRITVTGGGGSSGTGLLNASQLSIQSLNIAGRDSQTTEENKARIDYEATTFHDPYLYGDDNLFTQSIIELGDGLALEVTRNDFLDTMFKRATITQILASNIFSNLLSSTWESIYNSIMSGSSIFTDNNPSNVITLNTFIESAKSHPYDTTTVEQCQSPSTLLMDWIRYNPDQGYDVGKAMTISSLIAAYKQNHPDYA